ncbi:hypothetical protein HY008_02330 [Candidatus Woesebacteria bacterium]|nr:hypothetical protein [Candidatus Woesebacteria bacterium]
MAEILTNYDIAFADLVSGDIVESVRGKDAYRISGIKATIARFERRKYVNPKISRGLISMANIGQERIIEDLEN